jgi:hypothetical protein
MMRRGITPSRADAEDARNLRNCSGTRRLAWLGSPWAQARIRLQFRRDAGRRAERVVFGGSRGR